jgi:hypothetical protein
MSATASNFPQVYQDLGIDTGRLGCIMADTEPIVVHDVIPEDALYYADPDRHQWIQGIVSEKVPHVTLLYGLMRSGPELQKHVDAVLDGVVLDRVTIERVEFFYSNDPGENYVTLVAGLQVSDALADANARLRLLPHIDTFPQYKPHITLAYVKNTSDWTTYISPLEDKLKGIEVRITGLNYGG